MKKIHSVAAGLGLALLGFDSHLVADPLGAWSFEAYGGFSTLDTGFPEPGYNVVLTPLPPREHRDMGAFHWSMSSIPSLLGINQKSRLFTVSRGRHRASTTVKNFLCALA